MPDVPRFERKTAFRVTGATQFVAAGAPMIDFNAAIYDLGSNFDLTTNSYIVPLDGIYHFDGYIVTQQQANGDVRLNISIMVNSVEHTKGLDDTIRGALINDIHSRSVSGDLLLQMRDIVQLRISIVSGPAQNVLGGSALLFFNGHRIQSDSRTILGG